MTDRPAVAGWLRRLLCRYLGHRWHYGLWRWHGNGWRRDFDCARCGAVETHTARNYAGKPLDVVTNHLR